MAADVEIDDAPPPAVAVRDAIRAIEDEGRLTPEAVVRAASDPASPLHDQFEWDDEKAGEAYRLEQARRLIRSVRVVITTETTTLSTVHYVRDPQSLRGEQGYVSVLRLKTEPENAQTALRNELERITSLLRRAELLAEALGLRPDVERATKRVEAVKRRLAQRQAAV